MSPEATVAVIVVVAFIVGGLWQLFDVWTRRPAVVQAPPRTVHVFPPEPSTWTRDLDEAPDILYDATPAGLLRHYINRMLEAIRTGQPAAGYARMAASMAFRVHPELRAPVETALSPLARTLDPAEQDGQRRRVVRSMNVEVIS